MKQCALCALIGGTWSLTLSTQHLETLRDTSKRPFKDNHFPGDRGEKSVKDAEETSN